MDTLVRFQPIGALARVGGALADVPLSALAEYRKSQNIECTPHRFRGRNPFRDGTDKAWLQTRRLMW